MKNIDYIIKQISRAKIECKPNGIGIDWTVCENNSI